MRTCYIYLGFHCDPEPSWIRQQLFLLDFPPGALAELSLGVPRPHLTIDAERPPLQLEKGELHYRDDPAGFFYPLGILHDAKENVG